ncbi:uncharacterized protein LY89DRAFT_187092 [Mollisia scopiformis]|uniref:Uncharacterized protein n=1 Tax=Mollisia scopiformis TaxID=149040 RepID=A0A194XTR0_MOLSC|nr:uncharacterized protein LY89DRAFT_187092 [Mollisia scopiformis]KUJ23598.1 hypothetical protein LY89DRAFT_187092 [Mollisia scopiformis]
MVSATAMTCDRHPIQFPAPHSLVLYSSTSVLTSLHFLELTTHELHSFGMTAGRYGSALPSYFRALPDTLILLGILLTVQYLWPFATTAAGLVGCGGGCGVRKIQVQPNSPREPLSWLASHFGVSVVLTIFDL